jgi:hypothetical protein
VESGRVELRGLESSWNWSQELDSVGMGAEDVGSGLRARAADQQPPTPSCGLRFS